MTVRGERPVLAVVATRRGVAAGLVPLIRALSHWADVRPVEQEGLGDDASALLATSVAALARAGDRPLPLPTAVWLSGVIELPALADLHAAGATNAHTIAITDDDTIAAAATERLPVVPCRQPAVDIGPYTTIAPLVRARWRARLGLPADLVIDLAAGTPDALRGSATGSVRSSVAVAAVAVAGEGTPRHTLLEALAMGTPVVTDDATARWLGAEPGEVAITGPGDLGRVAQRLATGADADAARLSRRARQLAERLDIGRPARTVAEHLGLVAPTAAADALARLDERLTELGTSLYSPLRARALAAVEPFSLLQEAR